MALLPAGPSVSLFVVLLLALTGQGVAESAGPAGFKETIVTPKAAPSPAPPGMVWIPGGTFSMGSLDVSRTTCPLDATMRPIVDAQPIHSVFVDGFWMDQTEVTNEEFQRFVDATNYKTVAERTPRKEDFPDALPEFLTPGSVVFSPPGSPVALRNAYDWWRYVPGADWRHPQGPNSGLKGREKHPVVHVAYEDALAYADWAGKRLPTEAEFEFAARGGLTGKLYPWGDEFQPSGSFMANTFQGDFPNHNSAADGFAGTAPVRSYPANSFGLFDIAGNVWEWCSDWYRSDYYMELSRIGEVARNPTGPNSSFDPSEPNQQKRVQRGGSYLCTDQYCSRYMVGTRGRGEPGTATSHVGFRCVKSAA